MKTRILPLIVIALAAAGCSGVKNLTPARTAMPANYTGVHTAAADSLTVADMRWWEFYTDTILCRMIDKALTNNRDLLKAAARMEEMAQLYGIDKANYFPTLSALVGGTHETNDYGGTGTVRDPEFSLKATLAWETDLWGSLTWAKRRGKAEWLASAEDVRAMQMTLTAEVASAYFRLLALENELSIVRRTMLTRSESLEQARIRFEGGLTSETVFQQAKVEYSTTASLIPELQRQITLARSALTMLMGEFPADDLHCGEFLLSVTMPPDIPTGIPSELLTRRPDLRAAEQRLAASLANVGIAYARRFPSLKISLTGGLENDELSGFFKSPFSYLLGNITGTILDFGRNKRKYRASIAAYDQARYAYEQSVIRAFTEVSNAVATYRRVREAHALKSSLRDAAGKYVDLARIQYQAGTLNYIDVLDAQRRYFDAQIAVSNALRDEYLALINLYKSLGGGW